MFRTITVIIIVSNELLLTIYHILILRGVLGLFETSCGDFALNIIFCISIQVICSGKKPLVSLFFAWVNFKNRTPIKKFRKKKLPIRMKLIKNIDYALSFSKSGPLSIPTVSNEWYMISGHPSREDTIKSVIIASRILSKFESHRSHSPPASSHVYFKW